MSGRLAPALERLVRVAGRLEDGLLVAMLTAMLGFAVAQIVLRNLFDGGIIWADPLLRVLVLWVGMLGAMVAARLDNHISVNVLARFLPARLKQPARLVAYLFTAAVCALLAWQAGRFTVAEFGAGTTAFAAVPAWLCAAVMPLGFGAIALRYSALAFLPPRPEPKGEGA